MQMLIGVGMFGGLLAVLSLGVPIAFALLFVALLSLFVTGGNWDALNLISSTYWNSVAIFTLTSVPMFMSWARLFRRLAWARGSTPRSRPSSTAYLEGSPFRLPLRGVMAAVSGSSVATAAAIGGFAIAEMRGTRYRRRRQVARSQRAGHLASCCPRASRRLQRDCAAVYW
jgi:C4-dicarboxylate transporter DctM subunit